MEKKKKTQINIKKQPKFYIVSNVSPSVWQFKLGRNWVKQQDNEQPKHQQIYNRMAEK